MDRTAVSRIESQTRYVMDYEAAAIARALKASVGANAVWMKFTA
jgi:hypothetical protein